MRKEKKKKKTPVKIDDDGDGWTRQFRGGDNGGGGATELRPEGEKKLPRTPSFTVVTSLRTISLCPIEVGGPYRSVKL